MLVRSLNNAFQLQDWTEELNVIPNTFTTIGDFGIFNDEPVSSSSVVFEETTKDSVLIVDRVRGDRSNQGKDYTRKLHSFVIPHFNESDAIYPKDLANVRAYGSQTEAEVLANVRTRKMERIRRAWDETHEVARAQIITAGTVYAPNGTVTQDWSAEFGHTRTSVDFLLGTGSTEVLDKIEQCVASIQDNAGNGQFITGVVAFCSPTWFAKLISHPTVKAAYQYYSSTQEPLRNRLAANGSAAAVRREFFYGGVQFVECRDKHAGTQMIPAGKAYFVGQGTDAFKTYFAPPERFNMINTLGERIYYFEKQVDDTKYEIDTESNFACALMRPGLVAEATSSN